MNYKEVYIVGAGTYGEVMYELALTLGYKVKGFYDEDEKKLNQSIMDKRVLGRFSTLDDEEIKGRNFIVAIGNNKTRHNIMNTINGKGGFTPTLIHPTANVSPSAFIGKGVYIHMNATIWTKVGIGDYTIISPSVVIAHHTSIQKGCLISAMSVVGASLTIEENVFIGMNATIITGVQKIGGNSIIGAGTVVLRDTDENAVYAGVPARRIRYI